MAEQYYNMAVPQRLDPGPSAEASTSRKRTASTAGLDLEEYVSCPVCFEVFLDPKSLKCRHTICGKCVEMMLTTAHVVPMKHLRCPVCRQFSYEHDIMDDFQMQSLVSMYTTKQPKPKYPCDLCEVKSFEAYCEQCQKAFCSCCVEFHCKIPDCEIHTFSWKPFLRKKSEKCREQIEHVQEFGEAAPSKVYKQVRKLHTSNSAAIVKAESEAIKRVKEHYSRLRTEMEKNCTSFLKEQYQMQANLKANVGDLNTQVQKIEEKLNQQENISVSTVKTELEELAQLELEAHQMKRAFRDLYHNIPPLVNITTPVDMPERVKLQPPVASTSTPELHGRVKLQPQTPSTSAHNPPTPSTSFVRETPSTYNSALEPEDYVILQRQATFFEGVAESFMHDGV